MILTATTSEVELHPAGIFSAVCVDVIDLGQQEADYKGKKRMVRKVRIVWETEREGGVHSWISRTFTASLHTKSKLADCLGKWRGRPVTPGESIDLEKLLGACCTVVLSHVTLPDGSLWAGVDAISRPTKKVVPNGAYDPLDARRRIQERGGFGAGLVNRGAGTGIEPVGCPDVPVEEEGAF